MEALAYARAHGLHALVVARGEQIELETYADGYTVAQAHPLYSGTKSFWGVAALVAQREGILTLDELVSRTFSAWASDERKSAVTLRMLLRLTAGFGFGGLGNAVPTYDAALAAPLKNAPDTRFTYGGIALQVFGGVLARKLGPLGFTPLGYLRERVLGPAGVTVASWRTLADGTHPLPTGAQLTARDWLAYGRWVLAHRDDLAACFKGSNANPRYGLCWWLGAKGAPDDLAYASGAGGQALYIVASQNLAAVHFGRNGSYRHDAFLRRLFAS
ncbi:MAG TPA: serine hydrolase domain-containing protein [Candidatus Dormibacteraeota bacterium]|nr:serine hydrolase domain-containing protein [Candidatus Dormibacteraeota bacterium]